MYAAPVRVSAIVVGVFVVVRAVVVRAELFARTDTFFDVLSRDVMRVLIALRGNTVVPGRDAVVVRVAVRALSVPERTTVVETLDCVGAELFTLVRLDTAVPSRTAAYTVVPSENARIALKIRFFFISG